MKKNHQFKLIAGVTLGGILEWYEIFLYVYWTPQISQIFFSKAYGSVGIIETLLIFCIRFLSTTTWWSSFRLYRRSFW